MKREVNWLGAPPDLDVPLRDDVVSLVRSYSAKREMTRLTLVRWQMLLQAPPQPIRHGNLVRKFC